MKKLIELIKKLLGLSGSSDKSSSSESEKGFTLVELIIVIAILGILAVAVLASIDPIDKINAGNDTKVQGDIRQIYDSALRYYSINSTLPTTAEIVSSGELRSLPAAPSGYTNPYPYFVGATDVSVCTQVKSKAQRGKASGNPAAPAASAVLIANNGKTCYQVVASCPAGYTRCP